MGDFRQDVRYAARSLRLTPAFSIVAFCVLALGIGVTTAMFSVVEGVLLRPLPYPHSDQLVWLGFTWPSLHEELLLGGDYFEWKQGNRTLEDIAAFGLSGTRGYDFSAGGEPQRISGARVTGNLLTVLGVQPMIGRGFTNDEDRPGGPLSLVLSYPFWMREFGGQSTAVGSKVTVDDQPYTVIGVMPKEFPFPGDLDFDVILPQQLDAAAQADRREGRIFHAIGRLKPGVTLEQTRADLNRLLADAHRRFPFFYRDDNRAVVIPLQEHETGRVRLLLLVLLAAVGFILLIACTNVANLLLTRAAGRQREVAVRIALGASRARLLTQFMVESSLLSCSGGVLGVALAWVTMRGLRAYAANQIPRMDSVRLDWEVLLFALMVSLLTGILMGLAPAYAGWSKRWPELLKQGGPAGTSSKSALLRRCLTTAEIALSVMLVLGAGLMIKSLWRLQHVALGFEPQQMLTAHISLTGHHYNEKVRQIEFWQRVLAGVRALPGAESVGLSAGIPPQGAAMLMTFSRSDAPPPEPGHRGDNVLLQPVSPDYFRTAGIAFRRGRLLSEGDAQDAPRVAVANDAFVRKYFPNEDVIGRRVMGNLQSDWKTIVGVVADAKNDGIASDVKPELYEPYQQFSQISDMYVLVRTGVRPEYLIQEMRRTIAAIDPERPVVFKTVEENLDTFRSRPRFNAAIFASFAAAALLLAMFGIYGVLSYSTAQRTREIGVRMALGASPARILWWSVSGMVPLTVSGIILGLAGGWMLSRYVSSLLYEVPPHDAGTFAAVSALLAVTAFAATLSPARRAALVDPVISLRSE